jgi:peroxiredoxin Q/BCP
MILAAGAMLLGMSLSGAETCADPGELTGKGGLQMGSAIPDLSATNEAGETVNLASFKGRSGVVLFFFPKSFTPGCTAESCGFRDERAKFADKGYVVFGASRDTPEQLAKFKERYELSYPLLSDPEGKLAGAFGIPPGARQTVVIARDGTLEKLITSVTAKTHPLDLLAEFDAGKK